ncbi:hypothetical protein FOA52_006375 [Chlamydomonas sp. UWO 241]|nr:hypothetical protein FOA52_006375 [Chlamydomonas sp. UWO 241]
MIFEARYRVLFNTLLSGKDGVEEGLVQEDAPWCGTNRFGMVFVDNDGSMSGVGCVLEDAPWCGTNRFGMVFVDNDGSMSGVGCVLEIMEFANVPDGRLFVTSKGRSRFKVVEIKSEKPILVAVVEELPEEEETPEVAKLAGEVTDLLRSTIRLNVKMQNINATDDQLEPEELAELGPRDLSYWVASFFSDVTMLQQNLLEEGSTEQRLRKEHEVLTETVRYYSAASALKSAFAPGGESDGGSNGGGASSS